MAFLARSSTFHAAAADDGHDGGDVVDDVVFLLLAAGVVSVSAVLALWPPLQQYVLKRDARTVFWHMKMLPRRR